MNPPNKPPSLKLLRREEYVGVNELDPIRFYHWPIIGPMYRRRVELCLGECRGGEDRDGCECGANGRLHRCQPR